MKLVIIGKGGQGVIFFSKLIAQAAIKKVPVFALLKLREWLKKAVLLKFK